MTGLSWTVYLVCSVYCIICGGNVITCGTEISLCVVFISLYAVLYVFYVGIELRLLFRKKYKLASKVVLPSFSSEVDVNLSASNNSACLKQWQTRGNLDTVTYIRHSSCYKYSGITIPFDNKVYLHVWPRQSALTLSHIHQIWQQTTLKT